MKPDQMPGANQDAGGIPVYPADSPSPEGVEPRTEAGRALMAGDFIEADYDGCSIDTGALRDGILAIEREAALPEPPTWKQPTSDEPGGRRNPSYETECGECGTRLRITNNYSPQGDFLDQSVTALPEPSLDVNRVRAAFDAHEMEHQGIGGLHPETCDEWIAAEYTRLGSEKGTDHEDDWHHHVAPVPGNWR